MSKKTLTLEQEALVLAYLEYHHGKQMKGETRVMMYDIYRIFQQDRDKDVCSCLDRDTFKKVEGFINNIEWSEETRSSEKMKQLLPSLYLEPIQIEEESTQPVEVDIEKLAKAIQKRKRTTKK
jgi:hypothetical protein